MLNVASDRGARRREIRKERVKNRIQRRTDRQDARKQRREDRKGLVKPKPSPGTAGAPVNPRPDRHRPGYQNTMRPPIRKPSIPKPPQTGAEDFLSGDVAGQGTTKDPGFSQPVPRPDTKQRPTPMSEDSFMLNMGGWNAQRDPTKAKHNRRAYQYNPEMGKTYQDYLGYHKNKYSGSRWS